MLLERYDICHRGKEEPEQLGLRKVQASRLQGFKRQSLKESPLMVPGVRRAAPAAVPTQESFVFQGQRI